MLIDHTCDCGESYAVPDSQVGRSVRCPYCFGMSPVAAPAPRPRRFRLPGWALRLALLSLVVPLGGMSGVWLFAGREPAPPPAGSELAYAAEVRREEIKTAVDKAVAKTRAESIVKPEIGDAVAMSTVMPATEAARPPIQPTLIFPGFVPDGWLPITKCRIGQRVEIRNLAEDVHRWAFFAENDKQTADSAALNYGSSLAANEWFAKRWYIHLMDQKLAESLPIPATVTTLTAGTDIDGYRIDPVKVRIEDGALAGKVGWIIMKNMEIKPCQSPGVHRGPI